MTRPFDLTLDSIDRLLSDRLHRFAVNLLRKAAKANGHLTATRGFVCALYKGEWNTTRVALRELKDAGVIYLQNTGDVCLITFCAWLPLDESVLEKPSEPVIQNRSQRVTPTTSDETDPVIGPSSTGGTVGIGIGMVGRYDLDPDQDSSYEYLPTHTRDLTRANSHPANGNGHYAGVATLEAEPNAQLEQSAPPPSCDEPPAPDGDAGAPGASAPIDDAARIVAILTEPEIDISPANAARASKMHTFAFVVKQIATWWDNSDLGPGALFKSRLLNAKQFPPGVFSEAFQASELYDHHYPLQGEERERWRLWTKHKEHIDQVAGLEDLAAWAAALPPTLRRTLEQLPLPGRDA